MNASIKRAIASIDEDAWTAIRYPKAVWADEGHEWGPLARPAIGTIASMREGSLP
jgi:hypothetical protein